MKVYVVEVSAVGGMIHYDYHLCRALQRAGIDTTLVTSRVYELDDLPHNFRVVKLLHLWDPVRSKPGNKVYRIGRRAVRGVRYIFEWTRLVLYLLKEKPDVVLFGKIHFAFQYYFLKILHDRGLKLGAVVHDVLAYDTRASSKAIVKDSKKAIDQYNRIYELFSALFVHDQSSYDRFLALYCIPPERVHQIIMATNELIVELEADQTPDELRRELNIRPDEKVVLFLGTLSKYKGIETLVRAFPEVHKATGARLVVAGFPAKDVDLNALQSLNTELGMANHTSWFLDYVPNERISPFMAISDVAVYPYHQITQSAAIQIAYAFGKPVVASKIGGLADVVEDGKNGLLVPPHDSTALAAAITKIVLDPALKTRMSQHSKMLSETRFAWRLVAEKMKVVFEHL